MTANQLTRWATYASVAVASTLVFIKTYAWIMTSSVGVLASALDSAVDVVASLMILAAVRLAQTPADEEHRFGHGKAEPLAAMAQSVFIAGSALYLILHAAERLIWPHEIERTTIGVSVMLLSVVLTFALVMFQRYVVRKTQSSAIEADSMHYWTDLAANIVVLIALLLSMFAWLDATLGLVIGVWIGWHSVQLAIKSGNQLLDHELPDETRQQIQQIVLNHPLVRGMNDLRTYRSGPNIFIQFDLELDDQLLLVEAHVITEEVTQALHGEFENADVLIHQEPVSISGDASHHNWGKQ